MEGGDAKGPWQNASKPQGLLVAEGEDADLRSAVLGVDGNGLGAILGIELVPIGVAVQAGVGYDAHQVRGGSAFSVIIGDDRFWRNKRMEGLEMKSVDLRKVAAAPIFALALALMIAPAAFADVGEGEPSEYTPPTQEEINEMWAAVDEICDEQLVEDWAAIAQGVVPVLSPSKA